jgi:hypothetical protein
MLDVFFGKGGAGGGFRGAKWYGFSRYRVLAFWSVDLANLF